VSGLTVAGVRDEGIRGEGEGEVGA